MTVKILIDNLRDWFFSVVQTPTLRSWCLFNISGPINRESIFNAFDNSDLVKKYVTRYNEYDPLKKKQHSYVQTEINLIYGFRKAFVTRHKTKLQIYRDDMAQKAYHTRRTMDKAFVKFDVTQEIAEANVSK